MKISPTSKKLLDEFSDKAKELGWQLDQDWGQLDQGIDVDKAKLVYQEARRKLTERIIQLETQNRKLRFKLPKPKQSVY